MATNQLPQVNKQGGIGEIAQLFQTLGPMFGSGTTKSTSSSSADGASMNQADELLKKILGDSNPQDIDNMVANILDRAKQSFGPAAISANAAGVRAYSDSTLASMRNEAMARATGEAAKAKLDAINQSNQVASNLVASKLKSTQQTTQTQKTGISPAGAGLGLIGLGAQGYSLLKKKGVIDKVKGSFDTPDVATTGDFSAGGGFDEADFSNIGDNAFSAPAGDTSALNANPLDAGNPDELQTLLSDESGADITTTGGGGEVVGAGDATGVGGVVTGGFAMPPATPVDPATGIPNAMPAAFQMPEAIDDSEAIDALPADFATDISADGLVEGGGQIAGEAAGEGIGDLYFPGAFTLANYATEGALGDAAGQVVGAGEDIIGGTAGTLEDVVGTAGDAISDTIDNTVGFFEDTISNIGDGCFITTAATLGGDTDQGYTLKSLRDFRAAYMQTPERIAELGEYYLLAPFIVKIINEREDSQQIWKKIREDFLAPAVIAYQGGFPEATHEIYSEMMYWARQQVGLANTPEGVQ